MARKAKITTGTNDRPVDSTIAQSGEGLPDDSGRAPAASDEKQQARLRKSLGMRVDTGPPEGKSNPETVPEGTPGAGENICRRCSGSGRLGDGVCPDCNGSGKVITPLGGA